MKSLSWAAPFVAPFLVFMLFLSMEDFLPDQHYLLYPVKTALVVAVLAWYWRRLPSLAPGAPFGSGIVGVIGVVLWIGLDPWALRLDGLLETAYNQVVSAIGLTSLQMEVNQIAPVGRNPFALYPIALAWILFAVRVVGISFVVPIMEELFWRGFLMRWLIAEDFTHVALGTFNTFSFCVTTACFALAHGEQWPLGVIVGVLYGFWFVRTKSLGDVMIAHGVTNFLLAFYCLFSGDWHFLSAVPPQPK